MNKDYFKAPSISTEDPDNVEIFSLASTTSGNLSVKEIAPNIQVIENALTPDEIDYLVNLCKTATQEDWERYYRNKFEEEAKGNLVWEANEETKQNELDYWFDKSIIIEDLKFCDTLMERIQPFFGTGYHLPPITEVHRQKIGEGMDEHCDGGPARPELLRSMLFYINDDYEGGELYFPALDLEYKPKSGDFVTFPSYEKFTHGVRPVVSGSHRYVLAGFAWRARN